MAQHQPVPAPCGVGKHRKGKGRKTAKRLRREAELRYAIAHGTRLARKRALEAAGGSL